MSVLESPHFKFNLDKQPIVDIVVYLPPVVYLTVWECPVTSNVDRIVSISASGLTDVTTECFPPLYFAHQFSCFSEYFKLLSRLYTSHRENNRGDY